MNILQEKLASSIGLRESHKHEEARQILLALHADFPSDPQVNYGSELPCAWIHDLLGLEREAFPLYEKAIQTGLSDDDLKSALPGMGSTYRCIGESRSSVETFRRPPALFPNSHEFNVFLGMAYYNTGEYSNIAGQSCRQIQHRGHPLLPARHPLLF